jgi:hypothetical protein
MVNAPAAQGVSGMLKVAGRVETQDLTIQSEMELGHIIVVALDGKPLHQSERMLLQVMSEEQPTAFSNEPGAEGTKRIANIGTEPWLIKELAGTIKLKRRDAKAIKAIFLDNNGYPTGKMSAADEIILERSTMYYLLTGTDL